MKATPRYFTHIDENALVDNVDCPDWNPRDQGAMRILISSETGADLHMGIGWLQPGLIHLLHHHPRESEFYYIIEGRSTITVGGITESVSAGGAVYIPAGVPHRIVNDSDAVCVILFGLNFPEYENIWDE